MAAQKVAIFAVLSVLASLVAFSEQDKLEDMKKKMNAAFEECVNITKIDPEIVAKAFRDKQFPTDKEFKCFLKCTYSKVNLINDAGEINIDQMKKDIELEDDKAKGAAVIEKCGAIKGTDACEVAYELAKCALEYYTHK